MKTLIAFLMTVAMAALPAAQERTTSAPAESAARKLRHIEQNGARSRPDPTPTILSEEEINAYLASGLVKLPKGVNRVRFQGQPRTITAVATVDFDAITEGKRAVNPLLFLFSGVHDVEVVASASGKEGEALIEVQTVRIDNVEVPRPAVEFFVDRYVKPKYPQAGMTSRFPMRSRIDSAVVGDKILTVTQR